MDQIPFQYYIQQTAIVKSLTMLLCYFTVHLSPNLLWSAQTGIIESKKSARTNLIGLTFFDHEGQYEITTLPLPQYEDLRGSKRKHCMPVGAI